MSKAREFMVCPISEGHDEIVCDVGFEKNFPHETFIHVREVLPDTITISREELRKAWIKVLERTFDAKQFPSIDMMCDDLFGPLALHDNGEK